MVLLEPEKRRANEKKMVDLRLPAESDNCGFAISTYIKTLQITKRGHHDLRPISNNSKRGATDISD